MAYDGDLFLVSGTASPEEQAGGVLDEDDFEDDGSVVETSEEAPVTSTSVTLLEDPGIDTSGVHRFLDEVFGRSAGVIELAAFLQGSRRPVCSFRRNGEQITSAEDGTVFTVNPQMLADAVTKGDGGVTLRKQDGPQPVDAWYVRMTTLAAEPVGFERGGASNIREFFGFWLDGDYAVDGHHKTDGASSGQKDGTVVLPPDAETVRELWRQAGYPEPSVTWMTGGGINGLWLLENPVVVEDGPEGRQTFQMLKAASKRWHERVRMIALQQGYHHDTTPNLDRLLRLPGSVNRKVMHHPKAVTAQYGGPRYSLDDLLAHIPEPVRTEDGALIDPKTGLILKEASPRPSGRKNETSAGAPIEGLTPWDDFDARADWWGDVLGVVGFAHHGWAGQVEYVTRPGKERRDGQSASLNHDSLDKLFIFSDTVERTHPSVKPYHNQYLTKSQVLCHMVHGGDWGRLAADLRGRGYGDALPERSTAAQTVPAEAQDLFAGQLDDAQQFIDGTRSTTAVSPNGVQPVGSDAPPAQGTGQDGTFDGPRIIFRRASQIKLKRTLWMWDTTIDGAPPTSGGRIPVGMLTVAAGLPGTGKSQWAIWLTAQITRGTLPGAHHGTPKNVVYAATEDDWERTIAPRLVAAGADLDRVFHIAVQTVDLRVLKLSVPEHCDALGQFAQQEDVALVVLDPLLSHLGGKVNANAEREVRDALEPLVKAAAKYNFTVVGLSHFNKNSGNADPMERLMGSRGFSALLRALIVFSKDKDAEEGDETVPVQKFVLSQAKNNLGRTDMPSYSYTIASAVVETEEGDAYVSRFVLGPESETSVEDQLATAGRSPEEASAGQDCKAWLKGYLQHNGGEDYQKDIMKAAEKEGFTRSTLYRARKALKIPNCTPGFGAERVSVWRLPGAVTQGRRQEASQVPPKLASGGYGALLPKKAGGDGAPAEERRLQVWAPQEIPSEEPIEDNSSNSNSSNSNSRDRE